MVFSSILFITLFLPLVFLLYHAAGQHWKNAALLLASLLFYAWGEPRYVFLMLVSIWVNFRFGIAIAGREAPAARLRVVAAALAVNLGALAALKYANFFADNINVLLAAFSLPTLSLKPVSLPIGISFYTFHAISYLVDIHRRNVAPNRDLTQFSLYITLFPQLVAGPIIRYKDIYTQLPARSARLDDVQAGIVRFMLGLSKKVLIANPLGLVADAAFAVPGRELDPANAWLGLVCYTLQIYFDFSGYSDMAIGMARMFGFRFPENFDYPYRARSVQEFWRRWHISLSTWFRDYVYIPLGGNRGGAIGTLRNLWIVFLLTGLWHGASWNFVIWGAIHGLFLTIERLASASRFGALAVPAFLKHAYLLLVVMFGWVFFRSEGLGRALDYLGALVGLWPESGHRFMPGALLTAQLAALVSIAAVLSFPVYPALVAGTRALWARLAALRLDGWARLGFVAPLLGANLMALAVGQYNPFIYFRF